MRQARAVNINGIQKKPGNSKYKMGRKTSNFEVQRGTEFSARRLDLFWLLQRCAVTAACGLRLKMLLLQILSWISRDGLWTNIAVTINKVATACQNEFASFFFSLFQCLGRLSVRCEVDYVKSNVRLQEWNCRTHSWDNIWTVVVTMGHLY